MWYEKFFGSFGKSVGDSPREVVPHGTASSIPLRFFYSTMVNRANPQISHGSSTPFCLQTVSCLSYISFPKVQAFSIKLAV